MDDIKEIKKAAKARIKEEKLRKKAEKKNKKLEAKNAKKKKSSPVMSQKNNSEKELKRLKKKKRKGKETLSAEEEELLRINDFFDVISPTTIKFFTDYYIVGKTYRSVWAIADYPTKTSDQALLRYLGEKENVNIRVKNREVTALEERTIITNSFNKNKMDSGGNNDQTAIGAASNLSINSEVVTMMHTEKERLYHCACFIELQGRTLEELQIIQSDIRVEFTRCKMDVDELYLRQKDGFLTLMPLGQNQFGDRFERPLPAKSIANLFPFNYSGKTDEQGLLIGKDKFGTNIIVDFNKRESDKTNANILILGNAGQGKSYLLKLILTNFREQGFSIMGLDPEMEYADLTKSLNGNYMDMLSGKYMINILEPKVWNTQDDLDEFSDDEEQKGAPAPFQTTAILSQHISFLKDFFQSYKDMDQDLLDTFEILLVEMYEKFNITNDTDFSSMAHEDYPILSDLYEYFENKYKNYDEKAKHLYTDEMLRRLCLSLRSICIGSDSIYFNGHTNITNSKFLMVCVKGILELDPHLRDAVLFNLLSYMSNELLTKGFTIGSLDEFYLFLTNRKAVEYVRNFSKRVRKRESAIIIASQNLEDFNIDGIKELTKPLFSIPVHQFLFNGGTVDKKFYKESLRLEESEFKLIEVPNRGNCLYKCGSERYNLQVHAPRYKEVLFGDAGGR